jgi:(p)ppGpp synthase/HD superfamily hydrolase
MMSPEDADALAAQLLGDRRTRLGELHITHARRVAAALVGRVDDSALAAALLHDVIENTGVTTAELHRLTGYNEVVQLVDVLTQRPGEPERDYLLRCARDPVALVVKRADLEDKLIADDSAVAPAVAEDIRREALERLALLDRLSGLAPA